uniref:Uncharacterized protein n=1 Tax=Ditylenchus dipsaci TaxID=166011 RepID=A0A915ECR1_9BILA
MCSKEVVLRFAEELSDDLPNNHKVVSNWSVAEGFSDANSGDILELDYGDKQYWAIYAGKIQGQGIVIALFGTSPAQVLALSSCLLTGKIRVNNSYDAFYPQYLPKRVVKHAASRIGRIMDPGENTLMFVTACRYEYKLERVVYESLKNVSLSAECLLKLDKSYAFLMGFHDRRRKQLDQWNFQPSVLEVDNFKTFLETWLDAYRAGNIPDLRNRELMQPKIAVALLCRYQITADMLHIPCDVNMMKRLIEVLDYESTRKLVQDESDLVYARFIHSVITLRSETSLINQIVMPISREFNSICEKIKSIGSLSEEVFTLLEMILGMIVVRSISIDEICDVVHNLNLVIKNVRMTSAHKARLEELQYAWNYKKKTSSKN